jgi:membrane fusion protein (multidrug efflux system)
VTTLLERRLPVLCRGMVRADGRTIPLMVRDVSQGGVLLCISVAEEARFAPGLHFEFATQLPRTSQAVRLAVRVAWTARGSDHRGEEVALIGCRFDGIDATARAQLDQFLLGFFETFMIVDGDAQSRATARRALEAHYDVLEADSGALALRLLDEHEVAVIVLASQLSDIDAKGLLREIAARYPQCRAVRMVLTVPEDAPILEELSRLHRIYYYLRRPLQHKELQDVVRGAVTQYWESARRNPDTALSAKTAAFSQRVLEVTRRLAAQRDLATAARLAVDAVTELCEADRATCHVYDSISETLWSGGAVRGEASRSAIAGVAGYVARTGATVVIERAKDDVRFERTIDDPDAEGGERVLAVPLLSPDRRTLGVLIAVRNQNRPAFGEADQQRLHTLASNFSPSFGQMALQTQIEELFARQRRLAEGESPFRRAALEAHARSGYTLARPLQLSPRWVWRAYWLLVIATLSSFAYLLFGTMAEYAAGPAIVRIEGRTDITASEPGIVADVPVTPGQRVIAKQILVRLQDARELLDLERNRNEFELQLVKSLRNPGDVAVREALARLRTERDFAQSKLEARAIRAPHDGIVNDVRVRPGQSLAAGDPMLSITGARAEPSIVALIPGQYRPMLRPGQRVRLEVTGFRYAYADLEVETIGDEVVGPQEARRYLGKEVGDAVNLTGPVVLVKAHLPDRSFQADGKLYNYHDGMQATAEVRVRTQRIIARLIPALQGLPWFSAAWSEAFDER